MTMTFDSCDRCGEPAFSAFCDRCAALVEAENADTQMVEIPACDEHQGLLLLRVSVPWVCPVCGGPRGEVYRTISFDGSLRLHCDGWRNACGHIDSYSSVRAEAARTPQFASASRR